MANICEAEGISGDVLASMLLSGDAGCAAAKVIHAGSYAETGAPIRTGAKAAATIPQHAAELCINNEVPGFIHGDTSAPSPKASAKRTSRQSPRY